VRAETTASAGRDDLIAAVSRILDQRVTQQKSARKKRPKYRKGDKIQSLDELARQEFIFFHDKVYHRGWFGSWQLSWCAARIKLGELQYAIKEGNDEGEK